VSSTSWSGKGACVRPLGWPGSCRAWSRSTESGGTSWTGTSTNLNQTSLVLLFFSNFFGQSKVARACKFCPDPDREGEVCWLVE
jgi:hypothetical protein